MVVNAVANLPTEGFDADHGLIKKTLQENLAIKNREFAHDEWVKKSLSFENRKNDGGYSLGVRKRSILGRQGSITYRPRGSNEAPVLVKASSTMIFPSQDWIEISETDKEYENGTLVSRCREDLERKSPDSIEHVVAPKKFSLEDKYFSSKIDPYSRRNSSGGCSKEKEIV